MSPYRLVLIAAAAPVIVGYLSGKAGRPILPDILLFLFVAWGCLALTAGYGVSAAVQPGGILFLETIVPYLLARISIRNPEQLKAAVRLLYTVLICMLPFVLIETFAGVNVLLRTAGFVMPSFVEMHDSRFGLRRAQGVFEHPILFGVVAANLWALTHIVLGEGKGWRRRFLLSLPVALCAILSLSAGPISALFWQACLLGWNAALAGIRTRWTWFVVLLALAYLCISAASNQTVFEFLITHLSFVEENAYYRVLIWHFGSNSVANHPLFGTGFGPWDRPDWMPPSIDMFWLYNAITYGLPAGLLMVAVVLTSIARLALAAIDDPRSSRFRFACIAALVGYFVVGWTVHFWNGTYVLFMFLLGAGAFLPASATDRAEGGRNATTADRSVSSFSSSSAIGSRRTPLRQQRYRTREGRASPTRSR